MRIPSLLVALGVAFTLLVGCSNGTVNKAPVVVVSAYPTTVSSGQRTALSWTASNADRCTASGGWTGTKATSGSEPSKPLAETTTFTLSCTGAGGSAAANVSAAVGTTASTSLFPLHVEPGKRYLVNARGQPFFIHGDAAWSLIVQPTREQVDQYLEDRWLKGFNTVLVELIEHRFSAHPPRNIYGDGPFTVAGDFSTPNEAYFAHAEYVISKAAEKGFLVLLAPVFMGFRGGDEGWYQEMVQNGEPTLRGYGRYLANRFRAYDNILWVEGGDYDPPETALVNAVANGIHDVDARWLHTFHGARGTSALQFFRSHRPAWLTVNDIYTDENTVVSAAFEEYARSQMPFLLIEERYEGENAAAPLVRTQAYQAVLSGADGQIMGNNPVWQFGSGWQQALNSPGASTLTHLRDLIESVEWWRLQPDITARLLTAGLGAGSNRAAAAYAADGSLAIIYTPTMRDLTVNLAHMSGPMIRARWYDPTTGIYTTVAGSPLPLGGSRVLRPDRANAAGDSDWVLVLDSQH